MQRTQMEKLWLGGAAVVALLVLLIGWFMVIGPQRAQTSSVDDQVASTQLQNDVVQQRITALAAQSKNLAAYKQQLAQAQLALPATSGLPDFLRTLQAIGNATSTDVTSLSVGAPVGVTSAAAPVPTTTDTSTAAATAPPVAAAPSIYSLPITAQVDGNPTQLKAFLTQLQKVQPRAVLINQITYGTTGGSAAGAPVTGQSTMQLTMSAFVAPAAGAAAAVPTPTPVPTAG